jgi:hypothetical protein
MPPENTKQLGILLTARVGGTTQLLLIKVYPDTQARHDPIKGI